MTIKLYKCDDDVRTVNKSLSNPFGVNDVHLKDDTSLLNPVFCFHPDPSTYLLFPEKSRQLNYLYAETLGRYYFIKDITYSQQMCYLHCEIDPLMTWKDELLEREMFVARQGNIAYTKDGRESAIANILLPDDFIPVQANRKMDMMGDGSEKSTNFENIKGLTDGSFVLLINGGYYSI